MGCRVAGDIDSPEKLWEFLMDRKDGASEIDPLRWEPYRRRDARNAKELDKITNRGYYVDGVEQFDCSFFNLSPKEAEMMDPQQRIALEVCWEALEHAGIPPQSLAGSNTAVYMGVNSDDYSKLVLEDIPNVEAWMGIGTAYCGVPNRISYHLDLMGPSTAMDAACASSLVAIHHGRQSLLTGETDLVIAGGVQVLYGPGLTKVLDKAGAVSSEGICRSFDDESKGYGRGEGVGLVILKRLHDAINDGDQIIAVLKGSAVAQDGRTRGIMAPNGKAQELVARNALKAGNVDPKTIGYVEAHATSTPVGDPVEVTALSHIYGQDRSPDDPVYVGSIKPNIGHLEAGAGVMGFMKAALAVKTGAIPPQANLHNLNSKIDWKKAGVQIPQDSKSWGHPDEPRRAAIASYGYGGSVSHAVIEQNQHQYQGENQDEHNDMDWAILLLSGPQEKRLAGQAEVLADWILGEGRECSISSIAATLATRRGHHDYRSAFVVENHENAAETLKAFSNGTNSPWSISNRVIGTAATTDPVWVFSGHGAQWENMGKEMLSVESFSQTISALDPIVMAEAGFSAREALEQGDFTTSDRVQVLTYLMQVGLTAVLRSKGVTPRAIIGHSVGEFAAAVAAAALTPEEGAMLVSSRATLYRRYMGKGAMILVQSPYSEISQEIGDRQDICAAIDASPSSCVVSGAKDAVADFTEKMKDRGIKTIPVKSDIAFHSPVLNSIAEPLTKCLDGKIRPTPPSIKLYSTSSLDPRADEPRGIEYWINNTTKPVHLTRAVEAAAEDGFRVFMEVSSHPIVSHSIEETLLKLDVEDYATIPTMLRNKPVKKGLLRSIAQLHCMGVPVSWKAQTSGEWIRNVPGTIWNHQKLMRKIETGPMNAEETHDVEKHTLLGRRLPVVGETLSTLYMTKIDNETKPFPGNHPLHGTEIVPAAVLINTFYYGTGRKALFDIVLRTPVAINAPREVQVTASQGKTKIASRLIQTEDRSDDDLSWVTHTTGRYSDDSLPIDELNAVTDIAAVKEQIRTKLSDTFSIDYLASVGVSAMGFPWAVTEHFGHETEMIAKVDVAPETSEGSALPWDLNSWAPIFDSATSIGSTLFFKEPRLRMPTQIDRVLIRPDAIPPKVGYIHVKEAPGTQLAVDLDVLDEQGQLVAKMLNMRFAEIEGTTGASGSIESLVHRTSWLPIPLAEKPLSLKNTIIVSESENDISQCNQLLASARDSVPESTSPSDLAKVSLPSASKSEPVILLYLPNEVEDVESVPEASAKFCEELINIAKFAVEASVPVRIFTVTRDVSKGSNATALAQAPLHGLARIIASEQPDHWGGLIDHEDNDWVFVLHAIKYASGADVIQIRDGVAKSACLRRLPRESKLSDKTPSQMMPRREGTYLITGGLGALGFQVSDFLVENGARRLVLLSRTALPPRKQWSEATGSKAEKCQKVEKLEALGVTVHVLAVDIGAPDAQENLRNALDNLSLPPVTGIVHAAGVLEDQLVLQATPDSFRRVLAPKIDGSLTLHALFPPSSIDFMVLFSSCGQLFGFPGQASYASGNAFLDALATHRRALGDKGCMSVQWTSWRGLGMAASTDFINAELESKGITDITPDEGFRAWHHLARHDVATAVVLRSRVFDHDEELPSPLLRDIAIRRPPPANANASSGSSGSGAAAEGSSGAADAAVPRSGPELTAYVDAAVRRCVADTLHLSGPDDVDPRSALSDLGLDSVMTVSLRRALQKALGVQVPPTLIWSLPTAKHLCKWFVEKLEK